MNKGIPIILSAIFAVISSFQAIAGQEPVPAQMLGKWAQDGQCSISSKQLIITPTTAQFGIRSPDVIEYYTQDGPGDRNALHWVSEGVVSNLEYDPTHDSIYLNGKGWGYPVTAVYLRCAKKSETLGH